VRIVWVFLSGAVSFGTIATGFHLARPKLIIFVAVSNAVCILSVIVFELMNRQA
jgi:hypothetical protein